MKAAVLFAGLLLAPPLHAAVAPSTFRDFSFRQHPGAQLPLDLQLVDASGRRQSLGSVLARRPALLVLEYLRCKSLCSLVLGGAVNTITRARLVPGRDLDLVAVSIDPRDRPSDSAAAQASYAERFRDPAAAAGVRFFTGSPEDVRRLAVAIGFPYQYDRESDQFAHPAGFVVTTPGARISRYILGLGPDPAVLRQAVAEAGLERVEPPAHPLLCLCFGYDPDEGSVAALTWRLVRWTSLAFVLALAALITFLARRHRAA